MQRQRAAGNLRSARRQNLGRAPRQTIRAVFPDRDAFTLVRGNGKRQIAVFSDPNCPYCKQLDQGIAKLDDVTIYTFLYPILAKDSPDKARAIWCAPDRARTYNEWMLSGKRLPANAECDVPLQRMLELGRNLGIKSVPVTVMSNGQRVVGSRIEEVQRLLATSR